MEVEYSAVLILFRFVGALQRSDVEFFHLQKCARHARNTETNHPSARSADNNASSA